MYYYFCMIVIQLFYNVNLTRTITKLPTHQYYVRDKYRRTEVLIHIHPEGRRPEGCIWINTDVRGIYLTYFMKLFMKDLYIAILCSRGETPAN